MSFSDGTSVNFKPAATALAEGCAAAANTVTEVKYNSVQHVVWLYVPTTTYQQSEMVTDGGVAYSTGYTAGNNDGKPTGWTAAANTVSSLSFNTVSHVSYITVPTTTYQQSQLVTDGGTAYNAGYKAGWNACRQAVIDALGGSTVYSTGTFYAQLFVAPVVGAQQVNNCRAGQSYYTIPEAS